MWLANYVCVSIEAHRLYPWWEAHGALELLLNGDRMVAENGKKRIDKGPEERRGDRRDRRIDTRIDL